MTDLEYRLLEAVNKQSEAMASAALDELQDRCETFWDVQDGWSTVERQNIIGFVADAIARKWLGLK